MFNQIHSLHFSDITIVHTLLYILLTKANVSGLMWIHYNNGPTVEVGTSKDQTYFTVYVSQQLGDGLHYNSIVNITHPSNCKNIKLNIFLV